MAITEATSPLCDEILVSYQQRTIEALTAIKMLMDLGADEVLAFLQVNAVSRIPDDSQPSAGQDGRE